MQSKMWGKRPGLFVSNSRFYMLITAIILSVFVLGVVRVMIASDLLFTIRLQQIYGFLALGFWYLALLATPTGVILGKQGWVGHYLYLRRALGVSATYFALLHMLISLFGQLGGISGVMQLQGRFQLALIFGLSGLVVLLMMAMTSFDKVIRILTFPRWKWLHRVGYVAGVLVYAHVWMIGTHVENTTIRVTLSLLLALLALAESWRVAVLAARASTEVNKQIKLTIFVSLAFIIVGAIIFTPRFIQSYHSQHSTGEVHE